MTVKELNTLGIRQWEWISEKYSEPNLLLGNGFSINLSEKLHYNSLFANFINQAGSTFRDLFEQFNTTNFELIQEYLKHAQIVNRIYDIETDRIEQSINELKNGLIAVINEVHPRVEEIDWTQIDSLTEQLVDGFGDIFTLNYDMFLYHIIMHSVDFYNQGKKKKAYQDYYWGQLDSESKRFMPFQKLEHYKHVYYLHGGLCFFNRDILDYKILRNNSETELIDIIESKIQDGDFPLFVSEGTSPDKQNAISRSNYLDFCLRKLTYDGKPLMIYGTSLSENDRHILDAITCQKRDIIISMYIGNKTEAQLKAEKYNYLSMFGKKNKSIEFIDSNSVFKF